jgi:hypothetical protein
MTPKNVRPNGSKSDGNSVTPIELIARPLVIVAADANAVMQEQLDYLIEHAASGTCGCSQCERYLRVRDVLTEIFARP